MRSKLSILLALFFMVGMVACSEEKNMPSGPIQRIKGKIAVLNESDVSIVLVRYIHIRGDSQAMDDLGTILYPGYTTYLINILDGDNSQLFLGGDVVRVEFESRERNPDNHRQPLFDGTADLVVNGSQVIHVKDGGEYGISPE